MTGDLRRHWQSVAAGPGAVAFDRIEAAHVGPALDQLLAAADAALELAVSDAVPADYDALSRVLDVPVERLGRAWSAVAHLNEVADTPALRAAFNQGVPRVTDFHTRLGADERLYRKYRQIAASPSAQALCAAKRQALQHSLRDFVLGGAELQGADRQRFAQIQERAAELRQRYSENVLDATDRLRLPRQHGPRWPACPRTSPLPRRPRPSPSMAMTSVASSSRCTSPCYLPVMEYAHDRILRERLYRAHVTRASELGDPALDNTALMHELLELRQEEARLLGYPSYAELSLVPKMADSAAQVHGFLADLAQRARPFGERDLAELRAFAARELALPDLQPWDLALRQRALEAGALRLQQQRAAGSTSPSRGCLTACSASLRRCSRSTSSADSAPVWHDSVRFFSIDRARHADRPLLPRPACPPGQALGRLDGRRAAALGASRRPAADCRWRSWCATSRRRCSKTVGFDPRCCRTTT